MKEQVFLQLRVDKDLKEEAENILEKVGVEMPTAIRMFLKRVVLEGGIPFDTKIPEIAFQKKEVEIHTEEHKQPERKVIFIPAKPAKYLPYAEYLDLLKRVPAGKITRRIDIENYLMAKCHAERIEWTGLVTEYPQWMELPFWREVSDRGFLQEHMFCSKERQEEKLTSEGLKIVPCGAYGKSHKVENYQQYLFDFDVMR